ncbi:MAG: hypothetical protein R2867_08520 [Caldilineaceae bacterium]
MREAIVQPATDSGVYIERSARQSVVDDANDEPGFSPRTKTMVLLWEKPGTALSAEAAAMPSSMIARKAD